MGHAPSSDQALSRLSRQPVSTEPHFVSRAGPLVGLETVDHGSLCSQKKQRIGKDERSKIAVGKEPVKSLHPKHPIQGTRRTGGE